VNNTKARNAEIAAAARQVLAESGVTNPSNVFCILPLAKQLATRTSCHISTAKRHIRRAWYDDNAPTLWGGKREEAAAPEGNNNAARSYPK